MKIEDIRKLLDTPAYDFLRNDERIANRLILLTMGGSYSYGTNVETSDVDIRGCFMESVSDLIGLTSCEQIVETKTDTTVYGFNKLMSLLLNCNPNTIEILGCKKEHYLYMTPLGKELLDNKKMFLSQLASASFGGYATQQLRRLENALARDRLSQSRKEEHILNSMKTGMETFKTRYTSFEKGSVTMYTDKSEREGFDSEIFLNVNLKAYPAREFTGMINELLSIIKVYQKLNHRNNKKDFAHLNKHAMHLIRLYLMCIDILEKEDIITYRENDIDLLLSIRHGKFQKEDGSYYPEFFEMVNDYEKRLAYAKTNTSLPECPDMKKIEEFIIDVNKGAVNGEFNSNSII